MGVTEDPQFGEVDSRRICAHSLSRWSSLTAPTVRKALPAHTADPMHKPPLRFQTHSIATRAHPRFPRWLAAQTQRSAEVTVGQTPRPSRQLRSEEVQRHLHIKEESIWT